jgi:DNA-directed RNA polymerase specialized sigma24 family protein
LAQEPDPSGPFVDQFTERLREFLNALQDDVLRQIVLGRLAGYTNKELAAQTGLSLRAIERKLQRIRRTWNEEIEP